MHNNFFVTAFPTVAFVTDQTPKLLKSSDWPGKCASMVSKLNTYGLITHDKKAVKSVYTSHSILKIVDALQSVE